jgi:predicted nucleic-acid-binding protein
MRAVDTNVLVRLIIRDDVKQVAAAETFVAAGAWVGHVVLAETTWVLDAVYNLGPAEIAMAVEMLLNHQHLTFADADAIAAALDQYRRNPRASFSDCLVLATTRKAGHFPVGTFDRQFAKQDGTRKL